MSQSERRSHIHRNINRRPPIRNTIDPTHLSNQNVLNDQRNINPRSPIVNPNESSQPNRNLPQIHRNINRSQSPIPNLIEPAQTNQNVLKRTLVVSVHRLSEAEILEATRGPLDSENRNNVPERTTRSHPYSLRNRTHRH